MRGIRFLLVAVIALWISTSLLTPVQGQTPTSPGAGLPPYALRGPFSVGKTWFMLDKGTSKSLLLIAWYPALKTAGTPLLVPDEYKFANYKVMEKSVNWGPAPTDASPDPAGAPYPLIVLSPGYGLSAWDYINLEEHLASYGFIVISTALVTDGAGWASFMLRPPGISREIDFADGLNRRDGSFKGMVGTKSVGVVGHSQGGYTALAAAGAQPRALPPATRWPMLPR